MTFTKIKAPSSEEAQGSIGVEHRRTGLEFLKACTYRAPGTFHCLLPPSRADKHCPRSSVTQPIACMSENLPFSRHSAFKSVTEGCWVLFLHRFQMFSLKTSLHYFSPMHCFAVESHCCCLAVEQGCAGLPHKRCRGNLALSHRQGLGRTYSASRKHRTLKEET